MKDFKLESTPKINSGFRTPENYFNTLSPKIAMHLEEQQKPIVSLYTSKKLIWFAAAVLVIALMLPIFNYVNNPLRQIDENTLENYLSYQTSLNQYDLIDELDANDVNQLNSEMNFEEESIEEILIINPNIENYITE